MVALFKTLNYIFIGLFYAMIVQSEALAVEDIFNVDLSKDARGGCGSVGRERLQSLLDEAEALAAMGLELMDDYNTAGESTRLLNVFVRNNNADHRKNIRSQYEQVRGFLTQGGGVNGGKPYLLCSDTWLEKQNLNSDALDHEGQQFPADDLSGRPAQIRDVGEYMQVRRESAGNTPYYSRLHNAYLFDYSYGRGGYCSVATNQAVTSQLLLPATVTLCPQSFQSNIPLGTVQMQPLISARIPVNPEHIPDDAQTLASVLPTSVTMFHELFHLVMGNANTYPSNGKEEYNIARMGKLTAEDAVRNPETLAAMAVAYHYTRNVEPDDGNRVEFYGFFSTRG